MTGTARAGATTDALADALADDAAWADAVQAASLFAVDPCGTGGIAVRALPGPVRSHWLEGLRGLLPGAAPLRRVPLHVTDERLLGGLDLTATLSTGRPVAERGLLAEADGGVLALAMAERLSSSTAAHIAMALDNGELHVERDGLGLRTPSRVGVIALDEGIGEDEAVPAVLSDRLAFRMDFTTTAVRVLDADEFPDRARIDAARRRLAAVRAEEEAVEVLCKAALGLGIDSIRAVLLALRAARAAAALAERDGVDEPDLVAAARLVLAPRATALPAAGDETGETRAGEDGTPPQPDRQDAPRSESHSDSRSDSQAGAAEQDAARPEAGSDEDEQGADQAAAEVVLEAARAALPPDVLDKLSRGLSRRSGTAGKAGAAAYTGLRGRPAGTRRGRPGRGTRLNLVETLRAAAPWQRLRRGDDNGRSRRLQVRGDDLRVNRFKQRSETTTIFAVDASGSSALQRLSEAKGAVELLLADCYTRRDRVALVAFRGTGAELLLPPTRSLVRAKRGLAGLPGGGGTPLAAGIDAARALAEQVLRGDSTPTLVLLTDGRANIGRDGSAGREQAEQEALAAARLVAAAGITAVLVDTSPRPQARAEHLAGAMGARYLPLPRAGAEGISNAVRDASPAGGAACR